MVAVTSPHSHKAFLLFLCYWLYLISTSAELLWIRFRQHAIHPYFETTINYSQYIHIVKLVRFKRPTKCIVHVGFRVGISEWFSFSHWSHSLWQFQVCLPVCSPPHQSQDFNLRVCFPQASFSNNMKSEIIRMKERFLSSFRARSEPCSELHTSPS